MGQFKPMVKMMTTEPTVELKLAKGGAVTMKKGGSATKKMADGGGALGALAGTPALLGRPAVNASVRAPGRPSMGMRRKAMMARPAMPAAMPPRMKKGGEAGESKEAHQSEMKALSGLKKELKSHESKPASKGHKGLKTGGVINGQGGYKAGGIINTESQGGEYRNTKMHTTSPDRSPAKTGGVKNGNGGGYATGGVAKGNAGGYKKGGASKKAYATGGTVNKSGSPVAMPQGQKPASRPVAISRLAGTFQAGGHATKGKSGEVLEDQSKGAYERSRKVSQELEDALNPLSMAKELFGKAKNYFMPKGSESVTKTKESVTVAPVGKKRGGSAC